MDAPSPNNSMPEKIHYEKNHPLVQKTLQNFPHYNYCLKGGEQIKFPVCLITKICYLYNNKKKAITIEGKIKYVIEAFQK